MDNKKKKIGFLVFLLAAGCFQGIGRTEDLSVGIPDQEVFQIIFSQEEILRYEISWTGGIKIGDLELRVNRNKGNQNIIHARVTDYGLFKFFYPVNDTFTTVVRGEQKLPSRYEVLQKEGWGSVNKRLTLYDQEKQEVRYRRNDETEKVFAVESTVHNEFSSFYATRAMDLYPGNAFLVPTFADKKRNAVKVVVRNQEELGTVLGKVSTIQVMPIMKFKGLYDKAGDTVIWMTDDACRVPVKINSKILIGSLTATLVEYNNPACQIY